MMWNLRWLAPATGFGNSLSRLQSRHKLTRRKNEVLVALRRSGAGLLLPPGIFCDVHDLVFKDEQIGRTLAGQTHHILVVILDPAADGLSVHQFDVHRLLLLAQRLEKGRFLESIFGRWRPAPLDGTRIPWRRTERHIAIVHWHA